MVTQISFKDAFLVAISQDTSLIAVDSVKGSLKSYSFSLHFTEMNYFKLDCPAQSNFYIVFYLPAVIFRHPSNLSKSLKIIAHGEPSQSVELKKRCLLSPVRPIICQSIVLCFVCTSTVVIICLLNLFIESGSAEIVTWTCIHKILQDIKLCMEAQNPKIWHNFFSLKITG